MIVRRLSAWWRVSRGLTSLFVVNVAVLGISIVGRTVDDTFVTGVNVWDKPAKFAISFLLFAPTLLWLFSLVERTRWIRWGLGVLGWSMVVEIVLITIQSFRGRRSHFNYATSLDSAIFQAMAAGVGIFTIAGVIVGLAMARKRLGNGPLGLATKFAVPMMTTGAALGFLMTRPVGDQEAGDPIIGAHTNGAPDGGPGIPFLGWSTDFGDFRVVHFLGLHSLQIVPLAALTIVAIAQRRGTSAATQRRATILVAIAWGGVMITALLQALRELPVTRLDGPTFMVLGALALVPAVAIISLLWLDRSVAPTDEGDRQPQTTGAGHGS